MTETTALERYTASFETEPGYLDWAAYGPLPPAVRAELHADGELLGTGRRSSIDLVSARATLARELAAGLLGAQLDEVVLAPSTSHGLMQAIYGLSGGLVLGRREFPSLTVTAARAAEARGRIRVQWVDPADEFITVDVIREALTEETTAVAVSLVDFRTGYRADLAGIREAIGDDRLLIVDATQAFGIVDEDYSAADVVCVHGYKWLRAGRGTGFARFGPRALERIEPVLSGITGIDSDPFAPEVQRPAASARAFTVSGSDHLAAARLATALQEVVEVGVPAIADEVAERVLGVEFLADRYGIPMLTPRDPRRRGGIVALAPGAEDAAALSASLVNHGLVVTTRGDTVRIAPHVGTDADTVRLLGDALAAFVQTRTW